MDECQNVIAFNDLDEIDDATDCNNMVNIKYNFFNFLHIHGVQCKIFILKYFYLI